MTSCALSLPSFRYVDNGIGLRTLLFQKNARKSGGGRKTSELLLWGHQLERSPISQRRPAVRMLPPQFASENVQYRNINDIDSFVMTEPRDNSTKHVHFYILDSCLLKIYKMKT